MFNNSKLYFQSDPLLPILEEGPKPKPRKKGKKKKKSKSEIQKAKKLYGDDIIMKLLLMLLGKEKNKKKQDEDKKKKKSKLDTKFKGMRRAKGGGGGFQSASQVAKARKLAEKEEKEKRDKERKEAELRAAAIPQAGEDPADTQQRVVNTLVAQQVDNPVASALLLNYSGKANIGDYKGSDLRGDIAFIGQLVKGLRRADERGDTEARELLEQDALAVYSGWGGPDWDRRFGLRPDPDDRRIRIGAEQGDILARERTKDDIYGRVGISRRPSVSGPRQPAPDTESSSGGSPRSQPQPQRPPQAEGYFQQFVRGGGGRGGGRVEAEFDVEANIREKLGDTLAARVLGETTGGSAETTGSFAETQDPNLITSETELVDRPDFTFYDQDRPGFFGRPYAISSSESSSSEGTKAKRRTEATKGIVEDILGSAFSRLEPKFSAELPVVSAVSQSILEPQFSQEDFSQQGPVSESEREDKPLPKPRRGASRKEKIDYLKSQYSNFDFAGLTGITKQGRGGLPITDPEKEKQEIDAEIVASVNRGDKTSAIRKKVQSKLTKLNKGQSLLTGIVVDRPDKKEPKFTPSSALQGITGGVRIRDTGEEIKISDKYPEYKALEEKSNLTKAETKRMGQIVKDFNRNVRDEVRGEQKYFQGFKEGERDPAGDFLSIVDRAEKKYGRELNPIFSDPADRSYKGDKKILEYGPDGFTIQEESGYVSYVPFMPGLSKQEISEEEAASEVAASEVAAPPRTTLTRKQQRKIEREEKKQRDIEVERQRISGLSDVVAKAKQDDTGLTGAFQEFSSGSEGSVGGEIRDPGDRTIRTPEQATALRERKEARRLRRGGKHLTKEEKEKGITEDAFSFLEAETGGIELKTQIEKDREAEELRREVAKEVILPGERYIEQDQAKSGIAFENRTQAPSYNKKGGKGAGDGDTTIKASFFKFSPEDRAILEREYGLQLLQLYKENRIFKLHAGGRGISKEQAKEKVEEEEQFTSPADVLRGSDSAKYLPSGFKVGSPEYKRVRRFIDKSISTKKLGKNVAKEPFTELSSQEQSQFLSSRQSIAPTERSIEVGLREPVAREPVAREVSREPVAEQKGKKIVQKKVVEEEGEFLGSSERRRREAENKAVSQVSDFVVDSSVETTEPKQRSNIDQLLQRKSDTGFALPETISGTQPVFADESLETGAEGTALLQTSLEIQTARYNDLFSDDTGLVEYESPLEEEDLAQRDDY